MPLFLRTLQNKQYYSVCNDIKCKEPGEECDRNIKSSAFLINDFNFSMFFTVEVINEVTMMNCYVYIHLLFDQ